MWGRQGLWGESQKLEVENEKLKIACLENELLCLEEKLEILQLEQLPRNNWPESSHNSIVLPEEILSRSDKKWDEMVDSGDGEILEEESLYWGKGGLDCHPHVSSRQTVCDLNQGDHNMFISTFLRIHPIFGFDKDLRFVYWEPTLGAPWKVFTPGKVKYVSAPLS